MSDDKDDNLDDSSDDEILARARKFYESAREAESENRDRYREDIKFSRLGQQWPDNVKRDRELGRRPCLTFNKLPAFIRQVVNDARQNKPAITVLPVGKDSDKATAEILEGLIRNIEVQSCADVAYDTAVDNAVSGGWGYIRAKLDYTHDDAFDLDICIDAVPNPLVVYGDYTSTRSDSEDWNRCLVEDWIDKSEFKRKYPKATVTDWETDFRTSEDWITDDQVMVAEYWEREEEESTIYMLSDGRVVDDDYMEEHSEELALYGIVPVQERPSKRYDVTQYIITAAEVLERNEWPGQYIPVVPVYGEEVNEDGKRHLFSLINAAKDAQSSYNMWRTSAVEKVALDTKVPWIGPRGSFDSDPNWNTANVINHPYLEFDGPIAPFRPGPAGVPAADIQMALQASDDMKSILGIYDAALGARSNETSGKAIMARQREADTSTFAFIDNMNRAIRHMGKIVVDLIPKVYDQQRIVRIIQEDGTPQEVAINQQLIQNGMPKIFDVTSGKYDVVVKSGPSFTSRREESAEQMMQLVQAFPQAAPLIGDLIAKNLDWPGADDIAQRLQTMLPQQLQGGQNPEMQKQLQQVQGMVQQGQQMLVELQQQNQELKLKLQDKSGELAIKAKELELKEQELALKAKVEQAHLVQQAAELQARSAGILNPTVERTENG